MRESSVLVSESGGGGRGGRFPVWVPTGAAGGLVVGWSSSWWAFPYVVSSSQFSDSLASILTVRLVEVSTVECNTVATQLRSDKRYFFIALLHTHLLTQNWQIFVLIKIPGFFCKAEIKF